MQKIGLTGGIGSGKSWVAQIFESLGIPCYNADEGAKKLMNSDEKLIQEVKSLLGAESYINGVLHRQFVANKIFNDPELLQRMNGIIHPAVYQDFQQWAVAQQSPYVLEESAILFEEDIYKRFDANILVIAPVQTRIERVKKRSYLNEDQIRRRMDKQWLDEKKIKLADYIIKNDGQQSVLLQVLATHKQLLSRKSQNK